MSASPLIIGHRGASEHAPENSLAAFRMAIEAGADGVEFDVQLSRDGVPVVIHDTDLKRTGLRGEKVADLTAKELGTVDIGSWFNKRYPQKADPEFANETVPTLERVLQLLKTSDGIIYIELKCSEATFNPLVSAVCDVIRESPMLPRMIVKSFELVAIPEIRRQLPAVQTAALFEPTIHTIIRRRKHLISMARESSAHQLSVHFSLATKSFAAYAKEAGIPVAIWTADDPKWVQRCQKLGIRALISNDPARLAAARIR